VSHTCTSFIGLTAVIPEPYERRTRDMEYAIPVLLFLLVLAGGVAVLVIVSRATAEPGDTGEHSDATADEPRRAA
jgi:hypothetical protein